MSEVESALLLGAIDACGYISSAQFWQYREAYSYLYFWHDGGSPLQMFIGTKLFDSLPKEDQDILLKVGEQWEKYAWEQARIDKERVFKDLLDYVEEIELTQEEWEYSASLSLPVQIPLIEQTCGVEVIDTIAQNAPMIAKYRP